MQIKNIFVISLILFSTNILTSEVGVETGIQIYENTVSLYKYSKISMSENNLYIHVKINYPQDLINKIWENCRGRYTYVRYVRVAFHRYILGEDIFLLPLSAFTNQDGSFKIHNDVIKMYNQDLNSNYKLTLDQTFANNAFRIKYNRFGVIRT